ncbi:MAG: hypothetical protein GX096_15375 [Clostridiales bacterium]|nr:hypothetical protein [Clostridiales bacterium]
MKHEKQAFWAIFIAFGILVLILNCLTPMAVDDYTYAFSFESGERISSLSEIISSLHAHLYEMNGRVVPHFFVHLFTMLPRIVFSFVNTAVYLVFVYAIYHLSRGKKKHDIVLLCAIQASLFLLVPAFGQSFLWMAGSLNYLWCDAIMILVLIPFAMHFFNDQYKPSTAVKVLLPIGALLFGNMSENVSTAGIAMMGLCIIYLFITRKRVPLWMLIATVMSILGWLVLVFAPVNSWRIFTVTEPLLNNYDRCMKMFMDHALYPSLAFMILLAFSIHSPTPQKERIVFSSLLFFCALICNFSLIKSVYYPDRAFTGTLVLILLACTVLLPTIKLRKDAALALVLCALFLCGLNGLDAMRNNYDRYRLTIARNAEVQSAKANGEADVITFGIDSRSKYDAFHNVIELTNIPEQRINVAFAKYYGLNSVTVDRTE